jgi:hypothetical protein
MSSNFESINSDDIVVFTEEKLFIDRSPAFGSELMSRFKSALNSYSSGGDTVGRIISEGLPCKVLRPGNQWIEGKLKVHMEFEPNPPENSPLDEFRTDT